jgi:Helix-hairpin-helix domain
LSDIRRKPSSFEEYWLGSKVWERKGLPLGTARALANAGFLSVDDLRSAHDLELATIPRVGPKSLAILYGLMGRAFPRAPRNQMKVSGRRRQQTSSLENVN